MDGLDVRNNSEREPLKDHYSEDWFYLAQCFRRFKSKTFTIFDQCEATFS